LSKVSRVIVGGIFLLFTGCTSDAAVLFKWSGTLPTYLFNHPLPIPSFLLLPTYSPQPGTVVAQVDEICLGLNPEAFWEVGVFADELGSHLIDQLSMWVDGKKLPDPPGEDILIVATLNGIIDKSGNFIASWGGEISTCYKVKLGSGLHIVTVEDSSVSGRIFSYSWVFAISD
jgi:hypothetical protein